MRALKITRMRELKGALAYHIDYLMGTIAINYKGEREDRQDETFVELEVRLRKLMEVAEKLESADSTITTAAIKTLVEILESGYENYEYWISVFFDSRDGQLRRMASALLR
jgi:hypothetical protein